MEIGEILSSYTIQKSVVNQRKNASERSELIKEIYSIYTSEKERVHRKINNWKRYLLYLKENKLPNNVQSQNKFRKSKRFLKEVDIRTFCFFISHIPTKDLYYIKSNMIDVANRGFSASMWLFFNIKGGNLVSINR